MTDEQQLKDEYINAAMVQFRHPTSEGKDPWEILENVSARLGHEYDRFQYDPGIVREIGDRLITEAEAIRT